MLGGLLACVVGCVAFAAIAYFWLGLGRGPGEDVLRGGKPGQEQASPAAGESPPAGESSTGPLFTFGNPYLDGRSSWFRERFRDERATSRGLAIPVEPGVECRVHREAFTSGDWLEKLDPELKRHRTETESQTVESRVSFFVAGVGARELTIFLGVSGFIEDVEGEGAIEHDCFLERWSEPPEGVDEIPVLGPGQWLCRERWRRTLGKPTDVYYLYRVLVDGDCLALVSEAWRNVAGVDHAVVRLGSSQYALHRRGDGVLVHLLNFYSGQTIPPLLDGIAARMTASFYTKLVKVIQAKAQGWEAPPAVRSWFAGSL